MAGRPVVIKALYWDNFSLTIAFKSGTYVYSGVERKTYDALRKAKNQGRYVARYIRDKYPFYKKEDKEILTLDEYLTKNPEMAHCFDFDKRSAEIKEEKEKLRQKKLKGE